MANRLFNPDITFVDATGAPYAGAQLFFYQTGTSTKLATYSDSALTIANANPVVLDSSGRAGPIFLQVAQYKVILAPSTDTDPPTSPIWTQDPVYTSDYSTRAKLASGAGSPNGTVAGTAGSTGIGADTYWDTTNKILYVCTTTGSTSTAVWTAVNASTAAAVVPPPQGRLTPISATPVIATDSIAATSIYYTPYAGNLCPIYNGTSFVPTAFIEQQLTLVASHVASNIYDVFMFSNSGVPTIVTGPSWSGGTGGNITAGSCARGTGAGGAALTMISGILTNAVSITGRNGNTTYTINANLATYLGSIFMDGTNGQVSCYLGWGQSRKFGVWNAYNRIPIIMIGGDSTATWADSGAATIRPSNGAAANNITVFCGLAEEAVDANFTQSVTSNGASRGFEIGLGLNSTTAFSGTPFQATVMPNTAELTGRSEYQLIPSLGINTLQSLESALVSPLVFNGTRTNMNIVARYRG